MRHVLYLIILAVLPLLLGTASTSGRASAPQNRDVSSIDLGTAFTYQGRLTDGGSGASGQYDFRFTLYDLDAGGSQEVGNILTKEDVSVNNGLFTVSLDFGNVFNGTAVWLEVAVRSGNSAGTYIVLGPRQALTATPYALYAKSAWSVTGNEGTDPSTNFLGTTDNQPLILKTSGTEVARIDANGNVGIGTTDPSAALDVNGDLEVRGNLKVQGNIDFGIVGTYKIHSRPGENSNRRVAMTDYPGSFCALQKTEFLNLAGNNGAWCNVEWENDEWFLEAHSDGLAQAWCTARCLNWGP